MERPLRWTAAPKLGAAERGLMLTRTHFAFIKCTKRARDTREYPSVAAPSNVGVRFAFYPCGCWRCL